MNSIELSVLFLCASATLHGCAYPETRTFTASTSPALVITGAQASTTLYVDGIDMGPARGFDGKPNTLSVTPGVHLIEVKDSAGKTLFLKKTYLSDELKEIRVTGGP